jgi:hypothetical protein
MAISSSSISKSFTTSDCALLGGSTIFSKISSRVPIIIIFVPGFNASSESLTSSPGGFPTEMSQLKITLMKADETMDN